MTGCVRRHAVMRATPEKEVSLPGSAGSIPDSYDIYRYLIPTIFIDT